jgi:hypothetical protein
MLAGLLASALVPTLALSALQDGGVNAFVEPTARTEAMLLVFDQTGGNFRPLGSLSITHGLPEWQSQFESQFDSMTKGKVWRFGNGGWAILDATVPLTIGGKEIPAGLYYAGLARSKDDKWSLVLIDPAKAREKGLLSFQIGDAPRAHEAPLTYAKDEGKPVTQKLWVGLKPDAQTKTKATLDIRWGNHHLTAPVELKVAAPKDAAKDAPKPAK